MKLINPMVPVLVLNLAIIVLIVVVLGITSNPLAILGLLLLRDMPIIMPDPDDGGGQSGPMGFVE